ncbi:MAG: putative toxin-antitoxin system toxin component, PIN family [Acidobacteria bacterium]|nr:putative toxin-antitoxin system toxin component, PIN family [Acidobacteriota bacterium]
MIRIVLDTNVLVSALLQPNSIPAEVLMLALSGHIQLCVSNDIFNEYDEVIRRPHLKRPPIVIEKTLSAIRKTAHWVKPKTRVEVCSDPDDNMFLECAGVARAHYLVTGNLRHFPDQWKNTRVIGPRELIEALIDEAD